MTRFDPSLFVRRLIILSKGAVAFDQHFHLGVNLIRGEKNSVGKSTIAHMVFYILGGEEIKWTDAALQCSDVIAEVLINGATVTIQREISTSKMRPLRIYWGDYEAAYASGPEGWESYPFAQKGDSESFTQVLFRALKIPEVKEALKDRITMNQVLRLMFADQKSAPTEMFRHQDWIAKDTMDAVGALLCGYYDDRLYEIRMRLGEIQSRKDEINGQLKSIWSVLGTNADQIGGLQLLEQQKTTAENELKAQLKRTDETPQSQNDASEPGSKRDETLDRITKALRDTRTKLLHVESRARELEFEIEDSQLFIDAIKEKQNALSDAETVRSSLGSTAFDFCPACLAPISPEEAMKNDHCPLCKAEAEPGADRARFLRIQQHLALQLKESEQLQQDRISERNKLHSEIAQLRSTNSRLTTEHEQSSTKISTAQEEAIATRYRKIGYLSRQIEYLEQQIELATSIEQLKSERDKLQNEATRLKDEEQQRDALQLTRQEEAKAAVSAFAIKILKLDNGAQNEFKSPDSFGYSFRENQIFVNGKNNFSDSSQVYLRNAFHLALLFASTEHDFFRYPRLAIFDGLEEGGTVPERTQNLQRLAVELSASAPTEHQIIMTTSMIDPGLEDTDLTIGHYYTEDKKALDLPKVTEHLTDSSEEAGS
ncbi:hypothetical protein HED60_12600 [Planctomycetales bacterium ZRK34]|nr:hypothetical protein HED60_12600 [Planctomycetales bacterium ZRK34]